MEGLREYVMSVAAAGIICGIIKSILGSKGAAGETVKLICGLFLAFTVIRPVADIELADLTVFTAAISQEADAAVSYGEEITRESLSNIIKSETEAYILDKAASLNAAIQAEVTLSSDAQPVPVEVSITGQWSPYARSQLESILIKDLGIAKENQVWME